MALVKEFERGLDKLFHRRTVWLRRAVGRKRPGPAPLFTRAMVEPRLQRLKELGRQILLRMRGRRELQRDVVSKRTWFPKKGKGWGIPAKKAEFKRWYERRIGGKNCVYVFWSNGTCQYVGRTLHGKGRPVGWFDVFWFSSVSRIVIYVIQSPRLVPRVECLAIDLFDPIRNVNSAAKPKYARKCPICSPTKEIERELRDMFRLR